MSMALVNRYVIGFAAVAMVTGCTASVAGGGALPAQSLSQSRTPALAAYEVLFNFGKASGDCGNGAIPWAPLIALDGALYGTTYAGGAHDGGTAFELSLTGNETVLHSFKTPVRGAGGPSSALTPVDNVLYGTTLGAGSQGGGTVFSLNTNRMERTLFAFGNGADGKDPEQSNLVSSNGMLYGTTNGGGEYGGGTVFSISPDGKVHVLHNFGSGTDAASPAASLLKVNDTLYGTSWFGGTNGVGTVFSVSTNGGEQVLHSFGSDSDGQLPRAGLLAVNGLLYGTTTGGGSHREGTVYSITTSGSEQVIHNFGKGIDGRNPQSELIFVRGKLYGTTAHGGAHAGSKPVSGGTVFSLNPTSGKEEILHSFSGSESTPSSDGTDPLAGLVESNGVLYGTTAFGGAYGGKCFSYGSVSQTTYGTVFALKL